MGNSCISLKVCSDDSKELANFVGRLFKRKSSIFLNFNNKGEEDGNKHHGVNEQNDSSHTTITTFTTSRSESDVETDAVLLIRQGVIGQCHTIHTPFGQRQLVYADYTASGRFLQPIEDFFANKIAPLYANTHTEASATGAQTTVLREEARFIVAQSINAPAKKYATLFVGTGCTGAMEKMIRVLGIMLPKFADVKWNLSKRIPEKERPVVFIGPFEHHSNELSWRESIATVVVIPEGRDGCPNMKILEQKLILYKNRRIKIGSFSAGSNVTGIRIDTKKMTLLLHKHQALAFFDFAGSGAYVSIDVDGDGREESMDAIFMSPHKFIGGPGCAGVLVAKRKLFDGVYGVETKTPTFPGGGTVSFVGPYGQDYEETVEAREDAGTPGIVQAIRTGLAFQVKGMVGAERIEAIERHHCEEVFKFLGRDVNISLTGCNRSAYFDSNRRVPIFSFNIVSPFEPKFNDITSKMNVQIPSTEQKRRSSMRMSINAAVSSNDRNFQGVSNATPSRKITSATKMILHPGFVACILNDVYGIQARAGCSCTGPYGHRLFNMNTKDNELSANLRSLTAQNYHAFKPGWARVNFNYFISDEEVNFICDAITQIGKHGWKLLPFYEQEASSGLYIHRGEGENGPSMVSLADLTLSSEKKGSRQQRWTPNPPQRTSRDFGKVLKDAEMIYEAAGNQIRNLLKENQNIQINTFTEPLPSHIGLDNIWWATPQDMIHYLEQRHGRITTDRVEITSYIKGIDDVNIIPSSRTKAPRRGSMLKIDGALFNFVQELSEAPIKVRRDSITASFRTTTGMDREGLFGSVYLAENANMRNRG